MRQPSEVIIASPAVPKGRIGPWGLFLPALSLLVVFLIALILSYQWVYRDRLFLGLRAAGIELGGLKTEEARSLLQVTLGSYERTLLTLYYGEREWKLTPQQLGLSLDADKTVAMAYEVGRAGGLRHRLFQEARSLFLGHSPSPVLVIDQARQEEALQKIAAQIERPTVNAGLKIEKGTLVVIPPQVGQVLDREVVAQGLRSRALGLSTEPVALAVQQKHPTLLEPDLAEARAQVQRMTAAPVELRYLQRQWVWRDGPFLQETERRWSLPPERLLEMIAFREEQKQGRPSLVAVLDPKKAEPYLAELAKLVEQGPRNARFAWQEGKLQPIVLSAPKQTLNRENFLQLLPAAALRPDQRLVEVPLIVEKPAVAVEDASRMGITELIVEKSTPLGDAIPERDLNIKRGAELINGVVIPPGATFSFVETIGSVSKENGFALGFSIIENQTLPDVGGGICQVSTTIFQAAFWAGYSILERWPHAYRIRRYEQPHVGLDATVYPPNVDFKFKNDTASYLLIQARTDGERLIVGLYGTKPRWEVRIEEPVLTNRRPANPEVIRETSSALPKGKEYWVERAEDGVDVLVRRIILQDGKEVRRGEFTSRYRPQRNVLVVGTGGG